MMKNDFYFKLKALFVLKIFTIYGLISKFMMSHTVQQIITIDILPKIFRYKGNQAKKVKYFNILRTKRVFTMK